MNFIRAFIQVFSFELKMFKNKISTNNFKYYIIENTTRLERFNIYKECWNEIGYIKGKKLLNYIIKKYKVKINIYEYKNNKTKLYQEYKGEI